jgi:hypothetical protein
VVFIVSEKGRFDYEVVLNAFNPILAPERTILSLVIVIVKGHDIITRQLNVD